MRWRYVMAIIKCPHCGQTTTDTMSVCYHCGFNIKSLNASEESKKYYESYSLDKQQAIFNEFIEQDDESARFENFKANLRIFQKLVGILFWYDLFVAILVVALMVILNDSSGDGTLVWGICMIAALALMFIIYLGLAIYIIGLRISGSYAKRLKKEVLSFKKWLQKNKQLEIRRLSDELGTALTDGTLNPNEIYLGVKIK